MSDMDGATETQRNQELSEASEVSSQQQSAATRTPRKRFVGKRTADALAAAKRQEAAGGADAVEDTSLIVHKGLLYLNHGEMKTNG